MIRPIVRYGDDVLHTPASRVAGITVEIQQLVDDMVQTMYAAPGIGLAAPQVGVPLRIFVADISVGRNPADLLVFINPEFVERDGMVSVHVEAVPHLHRTITHIRKLGAQAGAVLNPATPALMLEDIAGDLDFVVVMSVNPGFGGQAFIPHAIDKVARVRRLLDAAGSRAVIEIDGGIDAANAADVVAAGAAILVAGQAIFGNGDPEMATRALRAACTR